METCSKSPGAIGNAGRMCIPELERIPSAVIQDQSLVHTGGGGTALLIPLHPRSSSFPGGLSHCPSLHVKFSWERWRVFQSQLLPVILQFLAIGLSQHPWPPWLGSPGGRVKDAPLCSCLGTGRWQECGKGPGAGILFWINSRLQLPFLTLPSLTDEHFKSAMCANFPLQTRVWERLWELICWILHTVCVLSVINMCKMGSSTQVSLTNLCLLCPPTSGRNETFIYSELVFWAPTIK